MKKKFGFFNNATKIEKSRNNKEKNKIHLLIK
jgi:hypothetical protein